MRGLRLSATENTHHHQLTADTNVREKWHYSIGGLPVPIPMQGCGGPSKNNTPQCTPHNLPPPPPPPPNISIAQNQLRGPPVIGACKRAVLQPCTTVIQM